MSQGQGKMRRRSHKELGKENHGAEKIHLHNDLFLFYTNDI